MNQTRTLLAFAMCFVLFLLWQQWQHDYAPAPAPVSTPSSTATASARPALPSTAAVPAPSAVPQATAATAATSAPVPVGNAKKPAQTMSHPTVQIDTDVLHLEIDSQGASIVQADLKAYPRKLHADQPVRLLSDDPAHFYVAQSGLVSASAPAPNHTATFTSARDHYQLAPGQKTLDVEFTWTDPSGIEVSKRYHLTRGSYVVGLEQTVVNHSASAWTGNAYRQFERVTPPPPEGENFATQWANPTRYSFSGAAWFANGTYDTLKFSDFKDDPLRVSDKGGWFAMQQAFFLGAWIPEPSELNHYSSAVLAGASVEQPHYVLRASGAPFSVAPGARGGTQSRLYLGPKLVDTLAGVAPGMELAVNYGMLTVIAKPLHWILSVFHSWVGNWGIAIILLVVLIKAVFFKLSEMQYRSMAKMKKLAPRMKALKERYPDDKQKQQQAMMEMYKQEKANPAGGCLPMLVQIPVFFGLYYMLPQSVELRQAPFFGWIQNLLAPDPFYVLPALYAIILIATQFLTPTTVGMDPTQAKMMKFLPVIFAVMFAFFPAGLVLYYVVNGALSLAQQWFITRRIEAQPSHA